MPDFRVCCRARGGVCGHATRIPGTPYQYNGGVRILIKSSIYILTYCCCLCTACWVYSYASYYVAPCSVPGTAGERYIPRTRWSGLSTKQTPRQLRYLIPSLDLVQYREIPKQNTTRTGAYSIFWNIYRKVPEKHRNFLFSRDRC